MSETGSEADDALAPSARAASRLRVGLGAAVVLLVVGIGMAVVVGLVRSGGGVVPVAASPFASAESVTPAAAPSSTPTRELVHVLGQVKHPGVYELAAGARLIDAVSAAGGFTGMADQGALNLAQPVTDGQQIYVPKPGEVPPAAAAGASAGGPAAGATGSSVTGGKVDLNSASLEQLETLPRVGPALGQRILDWREQNGRFASVDDLKNVVGIGDKTFADLRELVTVG